MALTTALTSLVLAAIAVVCSCTVAPITHDAAFDSRYIVPEGFFYGGQPAKTLAYELCCIALPLTLALTCSVACTWLKTVRDSTVTKVNRTALMAYLALTLACVWPIVHCPNPPFWMQPPSWILRPFDFSAPFFTTTRLLLLAVAAGAECYFLISPPTQRNLNRATFLLLIVWVALIPSRFYVPGEINDEPRFVYSLNSVLDSLSQSVDGHHVLVDFPHIYGGYGEILAPFIRLFPREIGTLIAALAVPHVVGMLCLLLTARLLVRRPAILFLCGMTLLAVNFMSSDDINYGYLTARLTFPPIGLLAATLYFRQPNIIRYTMATAITCVASVWNLDTGLVLWASWLGTLAVRELAQRSFAGLVRQVLAQAIALSVAWLSFLIYLRVTSGRWPDPGLVFYFQKLVLGSGYFCVRLIFPDMWSYVLGIYVIAAAVIFHVCIRGKYDWSTSAMLMTTLLGIGTFSYFMGRSVTSNLAAVAYPAILLAGILCSNTEIFAQRGTLPASARFYLLPTRIALVWWTFVIVAALPDLLPISAHLVTHWNDAGETPLLSNAEFVKEQVKPGEDDVYFLSNHSGIYYYLSDTVRSLPVPGTVELLQARDMDTVIDAISNRRVPKLFVDAEFYETPTYRAEVYDRLRQVIAQNYRTRVTGPDGRLVLCVPQ